MNIGENDGLGQAFHRGRPRNIPKPLAPNPHPCYSQEVANERQAKARRADAMKDKNEEQLGKPPSSETKN
jgi:hypothetical protein